MKLQNVPLDYRSPSPTLEPVIAAGLNLRKGKKK